MEVIQSPLVQVVQAGKTELHLLMDKIQFLTRLPQLVAAVAEI
jgi:hypothetical protein